jgi:hypothetical protein
VKLEEIRRRDQEVQQANVVPKAELVSV